MPRPRATPEQRNEQRERIRSAASDLYSEGGLTAISVRAVAEQAGTSQGTIYSYFTNLAELLRSLWTEPVAIANEALEKIAVNTEDPVARIRALLEAFVEFVVTHPDVHRNALLFVRPASQPTPDNFPLADVTFFRLLTEALAEAETTGRVSIEDPAETAELIWAGLHGALGLPVNSDIFNFSPPTKLASSMIDLLLDAIVIETSD